MVNVAEDRNTPMEPSDEALCRRAADGSREEEEALVRRYSGLVRSCARPLFLAGGDSEDLIQEGMFGLIRAIREYDGAKAASFRTFAEVCIRNRLISALRAASRDKHSPLNQSVPLDTPFFDGNSYPLGALRASSADPEELIIDRGYDPVYGARPLKRVIQREIEDKLSEQMLEGKVTVGKKYLCKAENGEFVFVERNEPESAENE